MPRSFKLFVAIVLLVFLGGCGEEPESLPKDGKRDANIDFVERFNIVVKDIRDFLPPNKNIEKYFHIIKSVDKLEDAKIIIFAEQHDHAANQLWIAGFLDKELKQGDVVLFEGAPKGISVPDITKHIVSKIFTAREYEKTKSKYKPTSNAKIWEEKFSKLYEQNKKDLLLSIVGFARATGFYWDLFIGPNQFAPDTERNAAMVETSKDKLTATNRVFIWTGALHVPHVAFAVAMSEEPLRTAFLATPGAKLNEINGAFFNYFAALPNDNKEFADTKVIFDYLKGQDFAVLIPKNLPLIKGRQKYLPQNAR